MKCTILASIVALASAAPEAVFEPAGLRASQEKNRKSTVVYYDVVPYFLSIRAYLS